MVEPDEELSFDKAEYAAKTDCAVRHEPLGGTQTQQADLSTPGDVPRAAFFGAGAALVSATVWYGIRELTGFELGLIAIAAGYFVGIAVRKGAGSQGGLPTRWLAVFFAYSAVAWSYVPYLLEDSDVGALLSSIAFAYVIPIWAVWIEPFSGLLGLIILGFALREAYRLSEPVAVQALEGPLTTDRAAAPSAPKDR